VHRLIYLVGGLILFLTAPPAEVLAQALRPGLKIGLATSTFSGQDRTDFRFRTDFMGGATLAYDLENGFLAQAEVLYVIKGARSDSAVVEDLGTLRKVDSRIAYLEFPVLASYRFETNRAVRPRLFAGPFLGVNVDATLRYEAAGAQFQERDDSVKSIELGIAFGGALDVSVGGELISFGLQSSLGLTDITEARASGEDPSRSTRSIQIFAGLTFQ
jgi:hypothetical protein